jgi:predicted nuclease with TOPRIM domain
LKKPNLISELADLYNKNNILSEVLKGFSFKNEEEAKQYISDHQSKFNELKAVRERIKSIELELKTDEEKKEYEEYIQKLKEKYSDD